MAQPQPQLEPKPINIVKGNPSHAVPVSEEVSITGQTRVKWSGPGDWLVVFDDPSPFERDCFSPSYPGNKSIVVKLDGREYAEFKYTVYVDGKRGADPIIIVKP